MKFVQHVENERGMALVTTLMFLVILFFLGVAAHMTTSSDLRISGYYRQSQSAFYAAESGIQEAVGRLRALYVEQFVKPGTTPSGTWRYYIGDSTLAAELGFGTGVTLVGNLSGMNYAVQLRFKTGADPNSGSGISTSDIIYWDGSEETSTPSNGAFPIFIATSLGAKGDARKKIIAEIRGIKTFLEAEAALYVNGNLTKNGTAGSAVGSYNVYPPDCPAVADVITTGLADPPNEALDWPAGTSDPPVLLNDRPTYNISYVVEQARTNYDQLVASGNNQILGSADDRGIFYSNGDWSGSGLNGYGLLVIGPNPDGTPGDFVTGGNIQWHGLIVVTGESVFDGGGHQEIYGAMIANAVTTVNGTPDYLYDCDEMGDLMNSTPKFKIYSWKEDSL